MILPELLKNYYYLKIQRHINLEFLTEIFKLLN